MSEITATQIDELISNGYIIAMEGDGPARSWWHKTDTGERIEPTFSAAASAAWEHYQQAKRPAKPQYPSGWVEYKGKGYRVESVAYVDGVQSKGEWVVVFLDEDAQQHCAGASTVRPCPPRPEPPKGWKLTGRIIDITRCQPDQSWVSSLSPYGIQQGCYALKSNSGLRWEAVRDTPQCYDAATFPKGEVWVRFNNGGGLSRALVLWVGANMVQIMSGSIAYTQLADTYELSLDGGRTWRQARPE